MPEWRTEIRARLAALGLRPERELEIVEEVAQHLDDRYREMCARGVGAADAEAGAWLELDQDDVLAREVARVERPQPLELPPPGAPARGRWVTALWQDVRMSARALRKQPLFTATVVCALALAIGPTTAVLSFGNWLFWRPLPGIANPDRLAMVQFGYDVRAMRVITNVTYPNIADLRSELKTADGFAGVDKSRGSLLVGTDAARAVAFSAVTADFFEVVGARPVAGRAFTPDDDRDPGGAPVAVISAGLATRSFGSPEAALGQRVLLNRRPLTVIGVASPRFAGIEADSTVEVWITGATSWYLPSTGEMLPPVDRSQGVSFNSFVARVVPGGSFVQLEAELTARMRALAQAFPRENKQFASSTATVYPGLGVNPLVRPSRRYVVGLLFTIGSVLLILGCANVANMLVARAVRREQETAVRKALGASGWRLVQLQLTESWMLAVGGALVGFALAVILKQVLQHYLVPSPPGTLPPVPIDLRVLALTMGVALFAGTIAGVAPAWLSARGRTAGALGAGVRTTTRAPRLRSGLAVVQLALSLTLLVGALLLVSTIRNLRSVDIGFDPDRLTTARLNLEDEGYDAARTRALAADLAPALKAIPALERTALAIAAPFPGFSRQRLVPPGADDKATIAVDTNAVSHDYFDLLGTPIVRGRAFTQDEAFASSPIETRPVILNELLAGRLFGDSDPIGRTVRIPGKTPQEWPVIGVVRDSHARNVMNPVTWQLFQPLGRSGADRLTVLVRSSRPFVDVANGIKTAVLALDPRMPLTDTHRLSEWMDDEIRRERMFATMLTWVSVLAFVLAALGLHGLVAQVTSERRREFGIRLAIGASRGAIARLVARYVLVITSIGTVIGLGLAAVSSRVVKAMLFGVTPVDPAVYAVAVAVMTIVVIVAAAWPAIRATRVEPVDVLRAE